MSRRRSTGRPLSPGYGDGSNSKCACATSTASIYRRPRSASPRMRANGSARRARPQPMAAPLPGILPRSASNSCCGCLVTRPHGAPWRRRVAQQDRLLPSLGGGGVRCAGGFVTCLSLVCDRTRSLGEQKCPILRYAPGQSCHHACDEGSHSAQPSCCSLTISGP